MPRPPLLIGTWGKINRVKRGDGWVAYARYRDHDGVTRQLERTAGSGQKAEDALKAALIDRLTLTGDDISPNTTIAKLGEKWFTDEIHGRRATNTEKIYAHALVDVIGPGLGGVRVREITIGRLERFLTLVTETRGPGSAKTTKSVLSGIMALAARHDAIDRNPLRDVAAIKQGPKKEVRVLDIQQLWDLRSKLYADPLAVQRDLVEPIDFMLATGARIGEVLAVRWFDLDLESEKASVIIRATVVNGGIQDAPKTKSARRRLFLPAWVVASLQRRRETQIPNAFEIVFASDRGTVRDPSNLRRQWRDFRRQNGYDWVTPHTFRKSVATLAVDAEIAAAQLGHADSGTTKQHYIPKTHEGPDMREVLETIAHPALTQRKQRDNAGNVGTDGVPEGSEKAS